MVVQHNLQAQFANRNLNISNGQKKTSTEKLSSGYRINRAADDAAGLAVSEKMRWQIRGLDKGSTNCADGASLIQVAEGALGEVHNMLGRMKELAVQGGNDTNTDTDREHIRNEMEQLAGEINRISDSTTFNTRYLFKGSEKPIINNDTGQPVSLQNIPISDFSISDVSLTGDPFNASTNGQRLNLVASLGGNYSISGTSWPLIYGSGSTSYSNFRYSYDDGGNTVRGEKKLGNMPITNVTVDRNSNTYSRTFSYAPEEGISFSITQQIKIGANDGEKQFYEVSYDVKNTGTKTATFELLHNEDTAYSNNDVGEQYYMGGTKLDHYGMYTKNAAYSSSGNANVHGWDDSKTDFSIYNTDVGRLPFTEKVKINNECSALDTVVFGRYPETYEWSQVDSFNCGISEPTGSSDKTFSIIWKKELGPNQGIGTMSFSQGIYAVNKDSNLTGVPMSPANTMTMHLDKMDLWIQSGATMKNGFFITVDEMNRKTLGIDPLEVASYEKASATNDRIDKAADKISTMRARLGSQQNRLEHSIHIDDNSSENTSAAESRIRDTNMAKEMVRLSTMNIIAQAGESMLAQANQSHQSVMNLLQ